MFFSYTVAMESRTGMSRSTKNVHRRSSRHPGRFPCKSIFNFVWLRIYISISLGVFDRAIPPRKYVEMNVLFCYLRFYLRSTIRNLLYRYPAVYFVDCKNMSRIFYNFLFPWFRLNHINSDNWNYWFKWNNRTNFQ